MDVLDCHLHLWDPTRLDYDWLASDPRLNRPFGPDDIAAATASSRHPIGFVFVQADCAATQSLAEATWIASLAERVGIRGLVAHAPIEHGAAVASHLDELAHVGGVVGVRRLLQDEPSGWVLAPVALAGAAEVAARGLTFDACVRAHQLADVAALADAVDDLSIMLDHLGKPPVGTDAAPADHSGWRADLAAVADRPNVWCKLSGLPGEAPAQWGADLIAPYLDAALEAFGPERLVFASDWPASFPDDPGAGYGRWLRLVEEWAIERVGDASGILAGNGARFYGLEPGAVTG